MCRLIARIIARSIARVRASDHFKRFKWEYWLCAGLVLMGLDGLFEVMFRHTVWSAVSSYCAACFLRGVLLLLVYGLFRLLVYGLSRLFRYAKWFFSEDRKLVRRMREWYVLAAVCEKFARDERNACVHFSVLEQHQKHVKPGDVELRKVGEEYIDVDLWEELEGDKGSCLKKIDDSRRAYHEAFERFRVFSKCEDAYWVAQLAAYLDDREPACCSLNQRYHHEGV